MVKISRNVLKIYLHGRYLYTDLLDDHFYLLIKAPARFHPYLLSVNNWYPITLTENGIMQEVDGKAIPPGTLPEGIEISNAAKDLLHKLLQCDPRIRLKSVQAMQRTAFFFGVDIQSYMLKENSPFRLLGRSDAPLLPKTDYNNIFRSFDSIANSIDTNIN